MIWRRVPPVMSPVTPSMLAAGVAGALHRRRDRSALEERLSAMFDARNAVLVDSGTSALVLALQLTVPPGACVALPGYGCIDMVAAAIRAGVRVRFYDIEPRTLSADLDSLRAAVNTGAQAIVVASFCGYPPDMRAIARLATEEGVPVIEDAAQGAGGMIGDRRVGAFGDLTVLSFGRGKGTTAGAGGALLIRNATYLSAANTSRGSRRRGSAGWRELLILSAQWLLARPSVYSLPASIPMLKLGEMVYHPASAPRDLSDAATAALPHAFHLVDAELTVRRRNARVLDDAVAESRRFTPATVVGGAVPGYLRYVVLDMSRSAQPAPALGALRGYPVTLAEHPATIATLDRPAPELRGAATLRDTLFTLPTHSRVRQFDMRRLCDWVLLGSRWSTPIADTAAKAV